MTIHPSPAILRNWRLWFGILPVPSIHCCTVALVCWMTAAAIFQTKHLPPAVADDQLPTLEREGTEIRELVGQIRWVGSRWLFVAEGEPTYRLLENLTLQRVVLAIRDDREDRFWTVSGTITEFLDENYLLLRRAVRTPAGRQTAPSASVRSESRSGDSRGGVRDLSPAAATSR